jgi:DNA-binding CsgD family transcriptional regulator
MPAAEELINRDITENIEEGIVLLDPELRTTFMNAAARRLTHIGDAEPPPLTDLVLERRVLDEEMLRLARGGLSFDSRIGLVPRGGEGKVPVDLHVKRLMDAYKETSGYLVIISRFKDRAHLRSTYRITEREIDVMHQLAVGKTNKEIAGFLSLSEKTIETHIASIYGKLMVKNRVELLKLLSGYDAFGPAISARRETPDSRPISLPLT